MRPIRSKAGLPVSVSWFSANPTHSVPLLKIGAMGPEDVIEHVDIGDPGELEMGILRRRIAAAKAQLQAVAS